MRPADALDALERGIAGSGQQVTLRREGSPPVEVTVMAVWRAAGSTDLTTGTVQGNGRLILSPRQVLAAGFPDPGKRGDRAIVDGRTLTVEEAPRRSIGATCVRVEWVVKG